MAMGQTIIAHYYPQCSGMPHVDDDDVEMGNCSNVTPLKYAPCRNSNIPSVTDLTGLQGTAISKIKVRSSTAAQRKSSQSTVSFAVKRRPPTRSTVAARRKPRTRSTAAATSRAKPPTRSTAAARETATSALIHSGADLLTSTVINIPDESENDNTSVDAIQTVV